MADSPAGFFSSLGSNLADKTGIGRLYGSIKHFGKKPERKTYPGNNYSVSFEGANDFRARIRVPDFYLGTPSVTVPDDLLRANGGILFPITPTITQDYNANYTALNPTHSNYTLYFYKNTAPGAIQMSAKFSVQNNEEAYMWLANVHLLRAIMKMRFGGDDNAGAPPPVCTFSAYGSQQYNDVPVVIQSFRVELPDSVDYYATKIDDISGFTKGTMATGNMVPTLSTFNLVLLPIYSREELLKMKHVTDYVSGANNLRQQGYL